MYSNQRYILCLIKPIVYYHYLNLYIYINTYIFSYKSRVIVPEISLIAIAVVRRVHIVLTRAVHCIDTRCALY